MSTGRLGQEISQTKRKQSFTSEVVFKYVNLLVVLILVFCIPGFLQFRESCVAKGIYVFSMDSLAWSLVGFIGIFAGKYSWLYFMRNRMEPLVSPKYEGEERVRKLRSMIKLSFDSGFYTFVTVLAYVLFREEYWFPSMVGGCGACSQIYRDFPNWPQKSRLNLQMYFMIQLGIHFFSLFEMLVIKRNIELKYYQYVLHHSVAVSLILFSAMSNQIAAGSMILIVHDASDILIAFLRFYIETANQNKTISNIGYIINLVIWVWMRVIVFPFCLLSNVYMNRPTPSDDWNIISFQYNYLLSMAFVLYGMHLFWTFLIIKTGISYARKPEFVNVHDKKEKI